MQAQLYALTHRGTPGDASFYARACANAESVLELGCGYGRLLPHLVNSAGRYRGLDLSPELLRLARRRRKELPHRQRAMAVLSLGDMRSFAFRERFDRVLIPHSALYCLLSARDVLRCLRNVRRHLRADGELIFDAYAADDFHAHADPATMRGDQRDWLMALDRDGEQLQVFESTRWKRTRQKLTVRYDYALSSGRIVRQVIQHRYLLREQIETLLARAGFAQMRFYGGFSGQRFSRRGEVLVVRAT